LFDDGDGNVLEEIPDGLPLFAHDGVAKDYLKG
jgi:hypothetical protein